MQASRELDALVAEKVMGWTPRGPHPIFASRVFATGHSDTFAPYFSSDVLAAWQVVQKMRELGWWMRLQSPFESDDSTWNAGFTAHSCTGWNGRPDHSGQGDTAPLAICLASLKALGVELPANEGER